MNRKRQNMSFVIQMTDGEFATPRSGRLRRWLACGVMAALMLASVGPEGSAQRAAEQPIWSGTSAGYAIQWTATDLAARPASSATGASFSARQMARQDFVDIEKDSDGHCEYVRSFKLLSVAGSI